MTQIANDPRDQIKGSIYGMAIGDALGSQVEFKPRGTFEPVDFFESGAFNGLLSAGDWTDDTSMALCLGESLMEKKGFDAYDQMNRYLKWYRDGYMSVIDHCFDIGNTIRQALEDFESNGKTDPFTGPTHARSAGNGSLMRLCPVPIFYRDDLEMAGDHSAESSKTTHGTVETVEACRVYGRMIAAAVNGLLKVEDFKRDYAESIISILLQDIIDDLPDNIRQIVKGSFRDKAEEEISSSGYVVHSLEAALWGIANSNSFEEGVRKVVNLGDDADTIGAIYGQLAGALYGIEGIPEKWVSSVSKPECLNRIVVGLIDVPMKLNVAEKAHQQRIKFIGDSFLEKSKDTPGRCWWIENLRVLGGPFPGSLDKTKAKQKLSDLLDLGVVAFVDLMEDGEFNDKTEASYNPYDDLLSELAGKRGLRVTKKQFYVQDQHVPESRQRMLEILNFINSFVRQGEIVYVHCAGGHGRTGTVAGCWQMCRGISGGWLCSKELIKQLREHNKYLASHQSPETAVQEDFLRDWEKSMMPSKVYDCESVKKLAKGKIPHFDNVDLGNPIVLANVFQNAIYYGKYDMDKQSYLLDWVICEKTDCTHNKYTGWAKSHHGIIHFKNGRPNGFCYTWKGIANFADKDEVYNGPISASLDPLKHTGKFLRIGQFEDGKMTELSYLGEENLVYRVTYGSFFYPSSFNHFLMQDRPWLKFSSIHKFSISNEYHCSYEEDDGNYKLVSFNNRKAIPFFYSEDFYPYLSLNQKLVIDKKLKELKEEGTTPVSFEPFLVSKKGPVTDPFGLFLQY